MSKVGVGMVGGVLGLICLGSAGGASNPVSSERNLIGDAGTIEAVKRGYELSLRDQVWREYQAYLARKEPPRGWLESWRINPETEYLPESVANAYSFYRRNIDERDVGSTRLFRLSMAGSLSYAVRTTTDGDDGWLEVFDGFGRPVGAARTYLEWVAWDEAARVRSVATGEGPEISGLVGAGARSFWKP